MVCVSIDDEAEYGDDKRCRHKETDDGIQKAEQTATTNQDESCRNGRQTPRVEVTEYDAEHSEAENTTDKSSSVIHIDHEFRRGTACRSRLRGQGRGGSPRRKVFGGKYRRLRRG